MSRKHKHNTNRKANRQQSSQYNRESVIGWCLEWYEYLFNMGCESEALDAFQWAEWCETASLNKFTAQCREWEAIDQMEYAA